MEVVDQKFSSVFQVIGENLHRISGEDVFKRILRRVTQFVKGKVDKAVTPGTSRDIADLIRA